MGRLALLGKDPSGKMQTTKHAWLRTNWGNDPILLIFRNELKPPTRSSFRSCTLSFVYNINGYTDEGQWLTHTHTKISSDFQPFQFSCSMLFSIRQTPLAMEYPPTLHRSCMPDSNTWTNASVLPNSRLGNSVLGCPGQEVIGSKVIGVYWDISPQYTPFISI